MAGWSTECLDWEDRILAGRSLVPDLPLFREEADRALRIFKRLKLPDVIGTPTMAEACGEWFFPVVEALFGSYDPATNRRMLQEFFQAIPKKNSKSSNGGAVMVVALIVNRRPEAEFTLIAPTMEIAGIALKQASGTIKLDAELAKLFQIQSHVRKITHRQTGATLQIKAADTDVITGSKSVGTMIDETHVFAKRANAADVFVEIRGALAARPDGFLFQTTTQSKEQPAGVFKAELEFARKVRDGKTEFPLLPVIYELPQRIAQSEDQAWRQRKYWPLVNPNMGRSVDEAFIARELAKAEEGGDKALALFASQHFNIEIGLNLRTDRWAGADFWASQVDKTLTLNTLIERCDVAVVGIDGGGMDDLLGLAVIGREKGTRRWLLWCGAWAHKTALDRRKEIAPRLLDFRSDGDLWIFDEIGEDVTGVADVIERLADAGLLPEKFAVGVDPAGIVDIVDELARRGLSRSTEVEAGQITAVTQGWKLTNAIKTAERRLAGRDLVHGGQPMMAWCVGNAKVEARGNAILITKQTAGTAKIDPLMAAFNAVALMALNPEVGGLSIYSTMSDATAAELGLQPTAAPQRAADPAQTGDIDRAILADPRHPRFEEMRQRYNEALALADGDEDY